MGDSFRAGFRFVQIILHNAALAGFFLFALTMVLASTLAAFGIWPWFDINVRLGGEYVENAGVFIQLGVTLFAVLLTFFLPSSGRVLALENSHRAFSMGIDDVARAYHHAHAADRGDTFQLSAEFDAMRERLAYLRAHPNLGAMEPEILELAAQMSFISRELAETYSTDNVARARDFLRQRQDDAERFSKRLDEAKAIHNELKHWLSQVELEEDIAASQLERLKDELFVILPEVGTESTALTHKVIDLPRAAE